MPIVTIQVTREGTVPGANRIVQPEVWKLTGA
jgi:phenylpyruvate tautomerase PptA (4-oxalocrotonate tautomerase family)